MPVNICAPKISMGRRQRIPYTARIFFKNFDAPFVEPTTVDGVSAAQLLAKIEARNPLSRIIYVIWDNAAYHKGPDVRAFLKRPDCRIRLIQLPPYCPHLNPIEQLWGSCTNTSLTITTTQRKSSSRMRSCGSFEKPYPTNGKPSAIRSPTISGSSITTNFGF